MSIHKGHRQRVREKFLKSEFNSMHPHEILEFLLFFALRQGDTNPIAHELINEYGTLTGVFDAPYDDLLKIKGLGENSAILLKMIAPLAREYMSSSVENFSITSTKLAVEFLKPQFIGRVDETVVLTVLDNKSSVIKSDIIHVGSVNSVNVNVRKIVEYCFKYNASAIILAHNHPNGIAIPSNADIITTKKLKDAVELLGIKFLDHIVIGANDFVSMADNMYF